MSKPKPIDEAPAHIVEWCAANPFAAADEFADRVREDARADVAMGRPIEDAQLIARGLAHREGSQKPRPAARKDDLQEWINKSVAKSPGLSAKERYNNAPEWVQEQVKLGRFAKRVTEARKKLSAAR